MSSFIMEYIGFIIGGLMDLGKFLLSIITIPIQLLYGLILYPIYQYVRGNFR